MATGKVEIGQGIKTAIAMIAAEELDVAIERIEIRTAHTALAPDESITAGSLSIEESGSAVRVASATARERLLFKAAEVLGVPVDTLRVDDGMVSSVKTNRVTDYWQLQAGRPFGDLIRKMPSLNPVEQYRLIGTRCARIDLPGKLTGAPAFIQDMRPPDLVHARIVRPPVPGSSLKSMASDELRPPGLVKLVRNGSFVGVVTEREDQAVAAAQQIAGVCKWTAPVLMHEDDITGDLRSSVTASQPIIDGAPTNSPLPPRRTQLDAASSLKATYTRPYQMHASLGPSAAVARYKNGALTVHTHSQWVESPRRCLADVLPVDVAKITLIHVENAGCYGHNGADDAALDAALLAMELPGYSVMLKWSREDEHRYEPYAPAMLIDMEASLDATGRVSEWRHEVYSYSHNGRPTSTPGASKLLSAQYLEPRNLLECIRHRVVYR